MRPGEVCLIRTVDVDISGVVWKYTPREHNPEHPGKERKVLLGPKAPEVR